MFLALAWATLGAVGLAEAAGPKVIRLPVAFAVQNTNASTVECASDGSAYQVKGELIGPASKLGPLAPAGRLAATLYLHDVALGSAFWSFTAVPRYDYAAAMGRAGHVSVVIDRLGYGASGRPEGNQTCLGAAADVAHQVIGKLRSGDYDVEGGEPKRFDKVALGGNGVGALIANIESHSFSDIDALVGMSYTPNVTQQAFQDFYTAREVCLAGGVPARPGGPGAYAYFGQTVADFDDNAFHSAEPAVRRAAESLRAPDPCGDSDSIVGGLWRDFKLRPRVKVPVLLVCGRRDEVNPAFTCPLLKRNYVGSKDVSLLFIRNTGHALTLERTAPIMRRRVSAWLDAHGF
jgi:pimeloyl-ACP methyl ester carboxylesterase